MIDTQVTNAWNVGSQRPAFLSQKVSSSSTAAVWADGVLVEALIESRRCTSALQKRSAVLKILDLAQAMNVVFA
jgi:hypothetical protein